MGRNWRQVTPEQQKQLVDQFPQSRYAEDALESAVEQVGADTRLVAAGDAFQRVTDWHRRHPSL